MSGVDISDSVDILPRRIVQMQVASHPGDYNCGPHVQVFVLCEDSTVWVQYHCSPNSNVPNDGRWHPVVQVVER